MIIKFAAFFSCRNKMTFHVLMNFVFKNSVGETPVRVLKVFEKLLIELKPQERATSITDNLFSSKSFFALDILTSFR